MNKYYLPFNVWFKSDLIQNFPSLLLLPTLYLGFPGGSAVKNPPTVQENTEDAGDPGLMPGSGGSLEEEMSTHSSILAWENLKEGGARQARVHGIAKSQT